MEEMSYLITPHTHPLPSSSHPDLIKVWRVLERDRAQLAIEYHHSHDEQLTLEYYYLKQAEHCIHYLARKLFDRTHKIPSLDRPTKTLFNAVGELYYQLFRVGRWMLPASDPAFRKSYYDNPYLLWINLFSEGVFQGFFPKDGKKWTKSNLIKRLQSENKQLQGLEVNPFPISTTSFAFTDNCYKLIDCNSDSGEEFRKRYWLPMTRERMKLTKILKDSQDFCFVQGETLEVTLEKSKGKKKQPLGSFIEHSKAQNKSYN